MKKLAFTLMELLTAMAIIGITAALVAPALTNIMPDKTKMQVIKAHKTLSDVTMDLLNDPSLYRDAHCTTLEGLSNAIDNSICVGLGNEDKPLVEPYNTDEYTSQEKYPKLLASKMEVSEKISEIDFVTQDGVTWIIEPTSGGLNQTTKNYENNYKVIIDLNGEKGPNSIGFADVKNPDQFIFNVDTYGKVTGHEEDKLTIQYLKTRTKFNNKKEDYKAAFGG